MSSLPPSRARPGAVAGQRVAPVPRQPAADRRRPPSTPPATLKLLWTYDAGDVIDSSAAIADGVVYVGGGDGDLIALDLASGTLRWKYATGNLIGESSPAVGGGAVYIGDLGGIVHAVNTRDGKRLWTFKTGVGDQVVAVWSDDVVLIGSYDGHLYALDARTGRLRWKVLTKGQVHATPAVQDGLAFIAGCDEHLPGDPRHRRPRDVSRFEPAPTPAASPVVDGDRAYFGTFNNEMLALDLQDAHGRSGATPSRTRSFPTIRPPRSSTAA